MLSNKRQRSIVDLLKPYQKLDEMQKSIRSRSLQVVNINESKEKTKKKRFVGDNYVPPVHATIFLLQAS